MITYRYKVLLPTLLILLFLTSLCQAAQQVRFSWALLMDTENGLIPLDFATPPLVSENNTLQLYFHPDKKTYLYVFLLDSSNFFSPVYPDTKKHYDYNPPGSPIRFPAGEDRFTTLPPAGQEKFYLIASPERLTKVEELLEECLDHPDNVDRQARLYQEVRTLRRLHSKLTQYTEKGMPVSGTMRSLNKTRGAKVPDSFEAKHIVANGFYSKILRLDHE